MEISPFIFFSGMLMSSQTKIQNRKQVGRKTVPFKTETSPPNNEYSISWRR
jgi:hypothetical protein